MISLLAKKFSFQVSVVETGYHSLMVVVGLLLIDIAKNKNLNILLLTY
jgi:hypothetical protein